jgi:Rrf2 family protein
MLSHRAKYALRALTLLAQEPPERPLLIADIAKRQKVPKKFLELILLDLKRHGVVRSFRGRKGGYMLARPADTIFFGQIIRLMDGPLAAIPCASLSAYRRCSDCQDEAACAIRRVMRQVRDSTAAILDRTSLAEAIAKPRSASLLQLGEPA